MPITLPLVEKTWNVAVWSSGSMLNGQSLFSWIEIKFRESVLSSGSFLSFQSLFSGLKEAGLRLFSLVVSCLSLAFKSILWEAV